MIHGSSALTEHEYFSRTKYNFLGAKKTGDGEKETEGRSDKSEGGKANEVEYVG